MKRKVDLQERQKDFEKKGFAWVEPTREWVDLANSAGKLALSNDFFKIKEIVKKNGSNRRVLDKKVQLDVVPPFSLVSAYCRGRGLGSESESFCGGGNKKDEKEKLQLVSFCRDTRIRTWDPLLPKQVR